MKSLNLLITLVVVFTLNLALQVKSVSPEVDDTSPFSVCKIVDNCKKEG